MRSDADRLRDVLEAILAIESRTSSGRDSFDSDPLVRVWVVHHLLILGEAAARLSDDITESTADIPWPKIVGLRNILVHQYFGIDHDLVWGIVVRELPDLKQRVERLLKDMSI